MTKGLGPLPDMFDSLISRRRTYPFCETSNLAPVSTTSVLERDLDWFRGDWG